MNREPDQSAIPTSDPFATFDAWFAEAQAAEPNDPNAMALATATPAGAPSVRMVLLKGHGPDGFVFYTNAHSRKGGEIRTNLQAALLFHWKSLRRQIRIEGPLTEVTPAEADAYFHSRPRVSQLASAASDQSRALADRADYYARLAEVEARFPEGSVIERPPHWTGFRLAPTAIEFWLDRPGRMHDRRRFERDGPETGGVWSSTLLYP
ncbi:pyridoxamine 5'-phosphate oxidase [Altererythrobacter sp. H2]|uniref:pyridoxamine 5'-phosphate oxidase n=1 Tax=Altererythrobacter sp. H2 TaxID=3108391 RepID=UPI002B4BB595|nr:pyridoxamine 5'-phosphate oxidase [Altererythrobacter sp. H2]WRK96238.1 pyridoxamine 5'-phosphate oxidase [Altererythrobacter sp. H2]